LARAAWPGRLEWVPSVPPLLLDGAHNAHGARTLARALAEPHWRRPWHLVFGCYTDKPGEVMLRALARHTRRVILTRAAGPRGRDPETLRPALPQSLACAVEPDPVQAVAAAARGLPAGGGVLAAGSLGVVGPIRRARVGPAVTAEWEWD
jgi:dihydrofolate synthase/folylpolyglutamate synthase